MKTIRKKQGYLKELQDKKKIVTVGIVGVQSGVGVTTLAISLAGYLAAFLKNKTAVVECGQKSDLAMIQSPYVEGHFLLKGIGYYPKATLDMRYVEQLDYDIAVIDYGHGLGKISDFMKCTHKIIIGSLEPWNEDRYHNFCEHLGDYPGSDTWLHIIHGDISKLRHISRAYGVCTLKRPYIENVHIVDKSLIQFFQTLF